jgi:hypothetical protein
MDRRETLPLTLAALYERLRQGERWQATGSDGLLYELFLDKNEVLVLRQGGQEHVFRQLEPAVMTIFNRFGAFSPTITHKSP